MPSEKMMIGQLCPECGADTHVTDTRAYQDGIRRRRECDDPECKSRFSTIEYSVEYLEDMTKFRKEAMRYRLLCRVLREALTGDGA